VRSPRPRPGVPVLAVLAGVAVLALGVAPGPAAAGYPLLPIADDRGFLGNLTAPSLTPGASGPLAFSVEDPLAHPLSAVLLEMDVYAFNGFPGNATSFVPVAGAPVLVTGSGSGPTANVTIGGLAPGTPYRGSVGVATSSSTPNGAYAVRFALTFDLNGSAYRLASRGWFSAALWAEATELPNGSVYLNNSSLETLGVSGVLPETAVLVSTSAYDWVLTGILAAAVVLIAAGAWVYFRRGGSSAGAR